MGWNCLAYTSHWFFVSCKVGYTTGSRNIKPEVDFKVQKMARYASFCLIMGPFKRNCLLYQIIARSTTVACAENPPRCHLTLVGPAILGRIRVSFTTRAVRSAILATAGLLVGRGYIQSAYPTQCYTGSQVSQKIRFLLLELRSKL